MTDTTQNLIANPLLKPSELPHGAFPFDQLKLEDYQPALTEAIARGKRHLEEVRSAKDEATFANTILALETGSEYVSRVAGIFFNLVGAEGNEAMQTLSKELSPEFANFSSDMLLVDAIFKRVKSVWDRRAQLSLTGEDLKLTEKTYKDFVRNGALLDASKKEKLRAIDQELAAIGPEYNDNLLKTVSEFSLVLEKKEDLEGLPESAVEAAAQAAEAKGHKGKWLISLQAPSLIPFMTYSSRRDLREILYRANGTRTFRGKYDNEPHVLRTVVLRFERARLLGYKTHAHFVLEERMAETPERVMSFLERIRTKAEPAARRDIEEVKAFKKAESGDDSLEAWDYAFWSEKLKIKKHDFDEEELRPYFKLENLISGVFEHARRLYGLVFKEVTNLPTYHPDVKTFEVVEENSGRFIGLFYADFFPRETKQGGAWATTFRDQGLQFGEIARPHASIVCNFTKPLPDTPSLLTLDEVRTLFHEFGHALHSLLSECKYVSLGGTNVYWDFVELPSQIMENWALEKEALDLFAMHYQTGAKIPAEMTVKIKESARFQAGMAAMRQVQFSMLDMAWHSMDPNGVTDVEKFENQILEPLQILPRPAGVNTSCPFSHIFGGGYSAGYYSYKWAEVLDADAFEFFKERGLFDKEVAALFRDHILSQGGTQPPMELYKKFRGREPDPDALLRRDGLL